MKTSEDLSHIESRLIEHYYGLKKGPRTHYGNDKELLDDELFYGELRDPGWKEAGLDETLGVMVNRWLQLFQKIVSCPSCGVHEKPGDCVDTLTFSERARETFKRRGWAITLNPLNIQFAVLLKRMGHELMGGMKGQKLETTLLLICNHCMRYSVECPYCSTLKLLAGRIEYDHEIVSCDKCDRHFAVTLFRE